ncbi:hypothetical protein Bpfe_031048, partial [Biomphalaria pfeifferi]
HFFMNSVTYICVPPSLTVLALAPPLSVYTIVTKTEFMVMVTSVLSLALLHTGGAGDSNLGGISSSTGTRSEIQERGWKMGT